MHRVFALQQLNKLRQIRELHIPFISLKKKQSEATRPGRFWNLFGYQINCDKFVRSAYHLSRKKLPLGNNAIFFTFGNAGQDVQLQRCEHRSRFSFLFWERSSNAFRCNFLKDYRCQNCILLLKIG